jgi:hypothetical protein
MTYKECVTSYDKNEKDEQVDNDYQATTMARQR